MRLIRHVPFSVLLFVLTVVTLTSAEVFDHWRAARRQSWWKGYSREEKLDYMTNVVLRAGEGAGLTAGFAFLVTPPHMHGVTLAELAEKREAP